MRGTHPLPPPRGFPHKKEAWPRPRSVGAGQPPVQCQRRTEQPSTPGPSRPLRSTGCLQVGPPPLLQSKRNQCVGCMLPGHACLGFVWNWRVWGGLLKQRPNSSVDVEMRPFNIFFLLMLSPKPKKNPKNEHFLTGLGIKKIFQHFAPSLEKNSLAWALACRPRGLGKQKTCVEFPLAIQ